ncbi:MAG: 16S rRNA (uracil(1498)-N(3))-methyltransferase [Verrucomicrobiales bacterium]
MSRHRFYIPPDQWSPESPALEGDEAKHCTQVLRLGEGARITVFNGAGAEATAEIVSAERGRVALRVLAAAKAAPLAARLVLAQALPKGKAMDLILQKATELGVAEIAPLVSERSVARPAAAEAEAKREKWQRAVIEAAKQCGQNWLPQVHAPQSVAQFLARPPAADLALIASLQPEAVPLKQAIAACRESRGPSPGSATILIGPEGDFAPAEINAARAAGYEPVTLGPIILRVETAAVYCLSVLGYELF